MPGFGEDSLSFICTEDMYQFRFAALSTSGAGKVSLAGNGSFPLGITPAGTARVPLEALDTGILAFNGTGVGVVMDPAKKVKLTLAANCTIGDLLKPASDGSGKGTPVSGNATQYYGAIALENNTLGANTTIDVLPRFGRVN
mgnify:CR=1 FL=1